MKIKFITITIAILILVLSVTLVVIVNQLKQIGTFNDNVGGYYELNYLIDTSEFNFYRLNDSIYVNKDDKEVELYLGAMDPAKIDIFLQGWSQIEGSPRDALIPPEYCNFIGLDFNINSEIPVSTINNKEKQTQVFINQEWYALSIFDEMVCYSEVPNFAFTKIY